MFRFWFLSLTYLRYQFKQVNDRLEIAVKYKNFNQIKRALVEHNYCCIKTTQLNDTFNYLILVIYYIAKPTLNVLVYITHAKGTHSYTRIAALNVFIICLTAIFAVNMLCVSVTSLAHKPLTLMYELSRSNKVNAVHKLKALAFIEKLSGRVIGFYCYKLYPMNNEQFYRSILGWAANYFLVINLITDMNLIF